MNPTSTQHPSYTELIASAVSGGSRFETLDDLYSRLKIAGYHPMKSYDGETLKSLCPVHERSGEHGRSLGARVRDTDNPAAGLVFKCYGGCDQDEVFAAMTAASITTGTATLAKHADINGGLGFLSGFEIRSSDDYYLWCNQHSGDDRIDETLHVYRRLDGRPTGVVKAVFRVNGKRTMDRFYRVTEWAPSEDAGRRGLDYPYSMQRHSLTEPAPLYGIHTVRDLAPGSTVFAVEGEKDVDTLIERGQAAVSTRWFGGTLGQLVPPLAGLRVVVIPDNDFDNPRAGMNYARNFAAIVNQLPDVSLVMLPPLESPLPNGTTKRGYDVTDFVNDGGTVKDLYDLAQQVAANEAPEDRAKTTDEFVEAQAAAEYDAQLQKMASRKLMELHASEIAKEADAERRRTASGLSVDTLGVDLTDQDILAPVPPKMLTTVEGSALLYPGEINTIFGKGGSLKTMLALYAIAQELHAGRSASMLSLELAPWAVVERLTCIFGVPLATIQKNLLLTDKALARGQDILAATIKRTGQTPSLMVVDSVNKVLGAYSQKGYDASEIISYHANMARPFTSEGVTFLNIDHPNREDTTRPTGSQEKMSSVQGAAYGVAVPLGQQPGPNGRTGYAELTLRKDQPGKTGLEQDVAVAWFVFKSDGSAELTTAGRPLFVPHVEPQLDRETQSIVDHFTENAGLVYPSRRKLADEMVRQHGAKPSHKTWMNRIKQMVDVGRLDELEDGGLFFPSAVA